MGMVALKLAVDHHILRLEQLDPTARHRERSHTRSLLAHAHHPHDAHLLALLIHVEHAIPFSRQSLSSFLPGSSKYAHICLLLLQLTSATALRNDLSVRIRDRRRSSNRWWLVSSGTLLFSGLLLPGSLLRWLRLFHHIEYILQLGELSLLCIDIQPVYFSFL